MPYYKIKNITGNLPKRHPNKDLDLKIKYNLGFQERIHKLGVGQEVVFSCKSLPVSIHTLRLKGFVSVIEISENEFMKLQKPSAKKTSKSENFITRNNITTTTTEPPKKNKVIDKKKKSTSSSKDDKEN